MERILINLIRILREIQDLIPIKQEQAAMKKISRKTKRIIGNEKYDCSHKSNKMAEDAFDEISRCTEQNNEKMKNMRGELRDKNH